ncbi:MAG TPA: hypothetical protein VG649_08525 [Candidatus Angelobacter sp.]|jgi:hypothetical protein|nr:hypothetical protein [Candidatus Angelobacter sp.]
MKKLLVMLFAAVAISAFAADTTVKGYLVDRECASEVGSQPGFGPNHTKSCLQMPPCEKSGYAVLTDDKKIIKLDDKGNEAAKKFIAALTKNKDIKVAVTGDLKDDIITVTKIELQ